MNIKELAEQAGFRTEIQFGMWCAHPKELERFAELVAAAASAKEREACAKLCEENIHLTTGLHHAAAIRARGDKHD